MKTKSVSLLLICTVSLCLMQSLGLKAEDKKVPASSKTVQFSEHLIAGDYSYPYGIAAGDIDGDGDLDLTSADCKSNDILYWLENDNKGNFKSHFIQKNDPVRLERHAIGDINQDGHADVIIVKNLKGHLLWFKNSGNPKQEKLWDRHVITTQLPGAYDVCLADVDKDGDLDVAASSWVLGNQFAWFENNEPEKGEWKKHIIQNNADETRTIRTADFDQDGDIDFLGTHSGNPTDKNKDGKKEFVTGAVVWYENSQSNNQITWTKHVIDSCIRPMHGEPVDMDQDGDMDVVMASGMSAPHDIKNSHEIAWYENEGKGKNSPWKKHVVQSHFYDAIEAVAGDLDNDGDIDVVATSWRKPGKIVWFENQGNPKANWKMHVLKKDWRSANQVILADFNNDGLLDIAACAEYGSLELRWWRNEGRPK